MKLIKPRKGEGAILSDDVAEEVERLRTKREDSKNSATFKQELNSELKGIMHAGANRPSQKQTPSNKTSRNNKSVAARKSVNIHESADVHSQDISLTNGKKEYNFLMHRAVHYLSMREHSVLELERKLKGKTEETEVLQLVMDYLLENDYVSDSRFAEAYVRFKGNKGQGPIKIRAELKTKGVSSVLIDEYLGANDSIWFDNALSLHNKKYGENPVTDYNEWTKRARFMQSRGFSMDHIHCVVPQVESND